MNKFLNVPVTTVRQSTLCKKIYGTLISQMYKLVWTNVTGLIIDWKYKIASSAKNFIFTDISFSCCFPSISPEKNSLIFYSKSMQDKWPCIIRIRYYAQKARQKFYYRWLVNVDSASNRWTAPMYPMNYVHHSCSSSKN